ncbi:MAG: EamA family transporter [Planctomycetota bacterium]
MPSHVPLALLGALGLAAGGLAAKVLVRYRICSSGLVTWGMFIGAAAAAATIWLFARPPFPAAAVLPLLGLVLSLAFGGWFLNRAMQEGDASTVVPLLSIKIPLTAVLAFFILGETHTRGVYAAVLLSGAAMALFGTGKQRPAEGGHGRHPSYSVALAALSALSYAFADQAARLALRSAESFTVTLWGHMLLGPIGVVMLFRPYYRQYKVGKADVALFLVSGFVTIGAVWAFYAAFERAGGVTVPNVILGARGLFVLAIGYLLRGVLKVPLERQTSKVYALRLIGTVLFMVAVALVSL